jgi:hypothetical protein
MIEDPIVEEVRRIRNEYAKQFNYDLDAVCRDLRQKQERSGRKIVSFPPKKTEAVSSRIDQDEMRMPAAI